MMKCILGFCLLLHLCYGENRAFLLSSEIIKGLKELDTLSKNKSNMTFPHTMLVPSETMRSKANSCAGVCIRELERILSRVKVDEDKKHILTKLNGSLNMLKSNISVSQNENSCQMNSKRRRVNPFVPYIGFFQALNNMLM